MKRICVIGSLNIDLTITIPYFHAPGETITGSSFATFTGGKGGNQAVALGRLGAEVYMVGMVGNDEHGRFYKNVLAHEIVNESLVARRGETTGVALIEVSEKTGDNRIALHAGANNLLSSAYIDSVWDTISVCDIFLMQLEIPMETVLYASRKIASLKKTLILDPAPAKQLPDELIAHADFITPNETELQIITGIPADSVENIKKASAGLCRRGARNVIAKMGAAGSMLTTPYDTREFSGFPVDAVDTTAAGDSFNAGFAYALSVGKGLDDAITFANAAGALSTIAMGAQAAMPTSEAVIRFINAVKVRLPRSPAPA